MSIKEFLDKIPERYSHLIKRNSPAKQIGNNVPEPIKDVYMYSNGLELPFGQIFNLSRASVESTRKPFNSKWYVFGKDNYFTFWLCALKPDNEGLWITSWDHESGLAIDDELVWKDLVEFLEDELEEFIENEE